MTREAATDERPAVSKPVAALAAALDEAGIRYCHWKSNEALERSLRGENDLDVLIDRTQATRFAAVLLDLGFVAAQSPPTKEIPGIWDFYAFQEGRPLHVHAHSHLVAGDDATKNFRIPIERAFLASVRKESLLPMPSPEFEYLVFVIRMTVKHCPWDSLAGRKGRLTASEQRELAWLERRIDRAKLDEVLIQHLPFVPVELFNQCHDAISPSAGFAKRARAGRRMLVALRAQGTRSLSADLALRIWRRTMSRSDRKRRPIQGGLIVAVVGGDGSGKSTAVDLLVEMLQRDLATKRLHLGKPPSTLLSKTIRFLARRMWPSSLRGPLGSVLLARDRHHAYMTARRACAAGSIVICDRFPLGLLRTMDGPRTHEGWAHPVESRYYRQLLPPDLLVVMRVDPATAVSRRPDQEASFVERRAAEVWATEWPNWALVIDAGRPLEEVAAEVRQKVWGAL